MNIYKKTGWLLVLSCLAFSSFSFSTLSAQDKTLVVRYLPPDEDVGSRSQYYYQLLKLALDKTVDSHGPYELKPSSKAMNQRDALKAMKAGQGVDVVHTMTDKTRERVLLPIRIPLDKGLIGVRLVMVNKSEQDKFLNVKQMGDLKRYTFGQGHDWPDTEILRFNDIKVNTAPDYGQLFTMLQAKNFDGFPRAVFEIWDEIENHKDKNLTVADGFYIYYPAAMYFFVRKDMAGAAVGRRLEAGLKAAIKDGSFDKLFNTAMMPYINKAKLKDRIGIKLKNPLLPEETPLSDSSLWYLNL